MAPARPGSSGSVSTRREREPPFGELLLSTLADSAEKRTLFLSSDLFKGSEAMHHIREAICMQHSHGWRGSVDACSRGS